MRTIPPALYAHLQQTVTTTCRLLLFTLTDGRQIGITTLDRDVTYMGVTYSAANGFDSSTIATDAGLSVDNGEARALVAAVNGITAEDAVGGALDDAQWLLLLVNWADLSMGHMILDAGDIGEVRVIDGQVYIPELLSFAMRLRQAIGQVWSRRCRAIFGTPAESQTGCGVDASALWVSGTVTAVNVDDVRRIFSATDIIGLNPEPFPGRIRWTSGPNASLKEWQIEAYGEVSGTVAMFEAMPFNIEVGHTFDIRKDCNKSPSDCISYGNLINYKGEPYIPVGDGLESMMPSAQVFGGVSGSEIVE